MTVVGMKNCKRLTKEWDGCCSFVGENTKVLITKIYVVMGNNQSTSCHFISCHSVIKIDGIFIVKSRAVKQTRSLTYCNKRINVNLVIIFLTI